MGSRGHGRVVAARRRATTVASAALMAAAVAGAVAAQAAPGALRPPSQPPSYLLQYNDELGLPGNAAGAAVTPTGHIYGGWGELALSVGGASREFDPASHTIDNGRVPVVRMFRATDGVLYTLTVFEASVLGTPVAFAHVDVKNLLPRVNRGRITANFLYDASELTPRVRTCCIRTFRFPRPRSAPRDGLYSQPGVGFNPQWQYAFSGSALLRDGQAVLFYPPAGSARKRQLLRTEPSIDQNTEWGRTFYDFTLPRFGRRSFDFRMPIVPVSGGTRQYGAIAGARFGAFRGQVRQYYNRLFGGSMGISVPERKVSDTFYASLAYMALPRYVSNGNWVQDVNTMRYHSFYLRDGAMISRAFDLVGLHTIARQNLQYFLTWQDPSGLFISRPQEYDGFGQALWGFGQHYRLSHDAGFARLVYPAVQRAMGWFNAQRAQDSRHLMPAVTTSVDNDLVSGHLTGDNFWAAAGVQGAIDIAKAVGDGATAATWTANLASFKANLRRQIAGETPRGPIRPSLDHAGGQIWGILWANYISGVYPANSPVVQNTMRKARRNFSEGILTYLYHRLLHAYTGFRVFQTDLAANHQLDAVRGFYSELAHTTSTNAGWEAATAPFGDRVIDDATTPHGWWAAEYVTLLRNMLVREVGDNEVYLMSAVSPSWLRPGRRITVRNAPTDFGPVSFQLTGTSGGAVLSWSSRLRAGTRLRWPVPFAAHGVRAPGLIAGGRLIALPGPRGRISVRWSLGGPALTYDGVFTSLMNAYEHSPNGATAHASREARDREAQRNALPSDLDRYAPLTLARGGR